MNNVESKPTKSIRSQMKSRENCLLNLKLIDSQENVILAIRA